MNTFERNFSKDTVLSTAVLAVGVLWFVLAAVSVPAAVPGHAGVARAEMASTPAAGRTHLSLTPRAAASAAPCAS